MPKSARDKQIIEAKRRFLVEHKRWPTPAEIEQIKESITRLAIGAADMPVQWESDAIPMSGTSGAQPGQRAEWFKAIVRAEVVAPGRYPSEEAALAEAERLADNLFERCERGRKP